MGPIDLSETALVAIAWSMKLIKNYCQLVLALDSVYHKKKGKPIFGSGHNILMKVIDPLQKDTKANISDPW